MGVSARRHPVHVGRCCRCSARLLLRGVLSTVLLATLGGLPPHSVCGILPCRVGCSGCPATAHGIWGSRRWQSLFSRRNPGCFTSTKTSVRKTELRTDKNAGRTAKISRTDREIQEHHVPWYPGTPYRFLFQEKKTKVFTDRSLGTVQYRRQVLLYS